MAVFPDFILTEYWPWVQGSRPWAWVHPIGGCIDYEAGLTIEPQPLGPWPPAGGIYTLERLAGRYSPYSPRYVLPGMAPPDARGPLQVLVGIVLGELDSSTPRVSMNDRNLAR